MIQIRGLYLKKLNSGYNKIITESNQKPFVMALQTYSKMKHKLIYPCYIQPKLDGIRLSANKIGNDIIMLSRRHKQLFGFQNIMNELQTLFSFKSIVNINPDLFTDGELYKHGMQLQNISSIVRQEEEIEDKNQLSYHIFDCFSPSQPDLTFEDRYKILKYVFDNNNFKYLVLVETILINSEQDGDHIYKNMINKKYEGVVYKNKNSVYDFSFDKEKRSANYLKRKKTFENEFKVVDFAEGDKGKGVGSIIFILETADGKRFRSTPKMTLEERSILYKDSLINFDKKYKGKFATIRYDNVSNDNIPLRSNFITFRDYE
jgi:ATP-dependent DNA ligase